MTDNDFSAQREARHLIRRAGAATLATLDRQGAPFASMVSVATTMAGEPVLLLSDLAVHTRNLKRDPRASLLLVAPGGEQGDPLAGSRLTLVGPVVADDEPEIRERFLAHHPEARGYADFSDFGFYRMALGGAHLVAGFGRIVDLARKDLVDGQDGGELPGENRPVD
ncbi:MAG: pyridoxamine 5'-phosphate oxidase family protein [Bauldia sp.]|uniref:HugZ family pyridoxamine 5'-phosphate oxidase n=1 Tax=Bauldia sp. TaxID=2575872 RepID=UPI001E034E5F|nr:pyridoxamine 5'-phosphate oxidase family protein [Bauldia sp.]MCB1497243.1 pyridoxamine 5'-phosphate oxidase family protein [Bauldia sp.]